MDSSGKIDSYEFICALALISHANLKQKAAAIFRLYDFDNSLVLNSDEMVVLIRCCLCSLAALCGRQDVLSIQEVEELVIDLLKGHDKDQDGQISLDEFQGIITKDKRILRTLNGYGLLKSYDLRANFGGEGDGDADYILPDCDSDLEMEENKGYDFGSDDEMQSESNTDQTDRIRQGIDFKISQRGDEIFEFAEDEQGDKWMANAPWRGKFKESRSIKYNNEDDSLAGTVPDVDLELEHVYGYRCHDTRNNIAYSPTGDIIYHTASIGIVMAKKNSSQKFFFGHYDDITCLDVYESLVATGQVGKKPAIHIWDSSSCKSRGVITSPLTRGISHVCFSGDGKKLAAISIDRYHSVAIYDVHKVLNTKGDKYTQDVVIAFSRGPRETVFHMVFGIGSSLIFGCKRGIYFGSIKDKKVKLKRGTGWDNNTPRQAIICVAIIDSQSIMTGSNSGKILKWKSGMLAETIDAHESSCTAICKRKKNNGIITGGSDGIIIVWDSQMNQSRVIDLFKEVAEDRRFTLNSIKIRAIAQDNNSDITIGTRGGELIELRKDGTISLLMQGHFSKELWGVCNLRNDQRFATVGQDFMLYIYDINQRKVKSSTKIPFRGTCIDSSPDGKRLAVGCKNGYVLIIDISTKQTVKTLKDREREITCLKFSTEGEWLSVAGADGVIINYNVRENYNPKSKFRGHSSRVLHLDFSKNSRFIQSMCTGYEILYSNIEDGKICDSKSMNLKDEEWTTWTLPIGWPVQGIWPPCSDGTDINAVARSDDQKLIATVDDFGLLKLFRFPVPMKNASYSKYIGHSSHVTNVIFTEQGSHVLTTGGNDKSVMQWRLVIDNQQANDNLMVESEEIDDDEDEREFMEMIKFDNGRGNMMKQQGMFKYSKDEAGEQMMANKPYLGELKASIPTDFEPELNHEMAPNQNLELHHVFGFRSVGAKDCVKYTSNGKVLFISASLGVVMEPETPNYQTFFTGHNDDVVSLAIHPKKKIAASGQVAFKGESKMIPIYVWDIETKEILATLKGFHRGCIKVLEFSPDGSKLLSIGTDKDNSLAIYDWARERLVSQAKVDKSIVTDVAWKNEDVFTTVGIRHIKFWKQSETRVSFKRGKWRMNSREPIISVIYCFPQNICFTGGKSGNIHTWRNDSCSSQKQAHKGPVRVLMKYKHILYSGGDDGLVMMWSFSGKLQKQREPLVNMANISQFHESIRSIDIKKDNTLLVGTRGSEIFEIPIDEDRTHRVLLRGHFRKRILGLAVHPKTSNFVTTGEDRTIRIWDAKKEKKMTNFTELDHVATSIDWSSDGQFLSVSLDNGTIMLLDSNLREIHQLLSTFTNKNNQICVIKISPDCTKVAFGAHGSTYIEVHNISNQKLISNGLIKGMTSVVNSIDWSVESNLIMANSIAYELKFFSVTTMKQVKSSSVKETKWYTWSCSVGWSTSGILASIGGDGTEINTVFRAQNEKVIATGEDSSLVKIYRYPSTSKECQFKAYKGHASHVNHVRFIGNDEYLVSTGSLDRSIIIWKTDFVNFSGLDEDRDYQEIDENIDPLDIISTDPKGEERHQMEKFSKDRGRDLYHEQKPDNQDDDSKLYNQFGMMIRPWQVTIKPPRRFLKPGVDYDKKPRVNVSLHHVFGYQSKEVRNSAKIVGKSVVFFTGALAISQKIDESRRQRYFNTHKNKITALTINSDRNLVATGEMSLRPKVYIWHAETLIILQELSKGLHIGVKALKFSIDSSKLLVVCSDELNTICIFNVSNGSLITTAQAGSQRIMDAVWVNNLSRSVFITVGINHFKMWTLNQGRLTDKLGIFNDKCKILICCALNANQVIVGNVKGELQVWKGFKLEKDYPLHDSCIDSIKVTDN